MADEALNTAMPVDLQDDAGQAWLVTQGCYLAERVADRGDMAPAHDEVRKARDKAYRILDPAAQASALQTCANADAYLAARESQAPELQQAAAANDGAYVAAQKLNEGQLATAKAESADLQAAQDAVKAGQSADYAYNKGYVAREAGSVAQDVGNVVAQATGGVLGPLKWYLLGGAVLLVGGVLLYVYVLNAQAKAATSLAPAKVAA